MAKELVPAFKQYDQEPNEVMLSVPFFPTQVVVSYSANASL